MMKYNRDYKEIIERGDQQRYLCRALLPEDGQRLVDALKLLSAESIKFRFLSNKKGFSEKELVRLTDIDFESHVAIALGQIKDFSLLPVGSARFVIDSDNSERAEFAITILDKYHAQGFGTLLLSKLIEAAKERGVKNLYGLSSVENNKIINLMKKFGKVSVQMTSPGVDEISLLV